MPGRVSTSVGVRRWSIYRGHKKIHEGFDTKSCIFLSFHSFTAVTCNLACYSINLQLQKTSVSQRGDTSYCLLKALETWWGNCDVIEEQVNLDATSVYQGNNIEKTQQVNSDDSSDDAPCWPCFYSAGHFIKEAGSKVGHLLGYWQWNERRLLWQYSWQWRQRGCVKLIGARTSRLEGVLTTSPSMPLGSPWSSNL